MEAPSLLKRSPTSPPVTSRPARQKSGASPRVTSGGHEWRIDPPHQFSRSVQRPLWSNLRAKRILDVVLTLMILVVLALPLAMIYLLIKLTSRGPAIYRQERVGLHGQPFIIHKFRTMRLDAEVETGPVWASHDDPRRTALGCWLRRYSIDELPQLWDVLTGTMSLVGPRPERPCFVEQFEEQLAEYPRRHDIRPGITGWAQINGWRGNTSVETRLAFDLCYVRNRSLLFDLYILALTPWHVIGGRNAV